MTDTTEFEKEDFSADEGSTPPKYNLKTKYTRVEKREKEYVALNDLHGLSLGINLAGDTYWRKELETLNSALADDSTYQEYEGKFDKDTQTFTLTDGVKFFPNYSKEELATPISFTTTEWLATMKKTWDEGTEWEFTDYAHLHVFSHDTRQGYSITSQAMNNPTDNTAPEGANDREKREDTSSGVSSEVISVVKDLSEISEGLKCLQSVLLRRLPKRPLDRSQELRRPLEARSATLTTMTLVLIPLCCSGAKSHGRRGRNLYGEVVPRVSRGIDRVS